jgi:hypothetical protein
MTILRFRYNHTANDMPLRMSTASTGLGDVNPPQGITTQAFCAIGHATIGGKNNEDMREDVE